MEEQTLEQSYQMEQIEIVIEKSLLEEVHKINQKLIEGKIKYADLQIKIDDFNKKIIDLHNQISTLQDDEKYLKERAGDDDFRKAELRNALEVLSKAFQVKLNDIAKSYGIESNEDARWNFDFLAGKFVKVQQ